MFPLGKASAQGGAWPPKKNSSEEVGLAEKGLAPGVSSEDGVFRGFFVALISLEKQCSGLFRGFFVVLVLGKFYAYSPYPKNLLRLFLRNNLKFLRLF